MNKEPKARTSSESLGENLPVLPAIQYRGLREQERVEARRAKLLEAALHLFGTNGLGGTSMRDLAAMARVRLSLAQELYASKEQLLVALHKNLAQQVAQRMALRYGEAGGDAQFQMAFRASIKEYLVYLKEDPQRARVLLIEAAGLNLDDPTNLDAHISRYTETFRRQFRTCFPDVYKQVDYQIALSGHAGLVVNACRSWMARGFDLDIDSMAEHCMLVFHGLRALLERLLRESAGATAAHEENADKKILEHLRTGLPE